MAQNYTIKKTYSQEPLTRVDSFLHGDIRNVQNVTLNTGSSSPQGGNNFVTAGSFSIVNGEVTLEREGLGDVVFGLDGRYALISDVANIGLQEVTDVNSITTNAVTIDNDLVISEYIKHKDNLTSYFGFAETDKILAVTEGYETLMLEDGVVYLKYQDATKLQTTTAGVIISGNSYAVGLVTGLTGGYFGGDVDVTGTVTVTDVIDIKKTNSSALRLWNNTTFVGGFGTQDWATSGDVLGLGIAVSDGTKSLTVDIGLSTVLEVDSSGIDVTGTGTFSDAIYLTGTGLSDRFIWDTGGSNQVLIGADSNIFYLFAGNGANTQSVLFGNTGIPLIEFRGSAMDIEMPLDITGDLDVTGTVTGSGVASFTASADNVLLVTSTDPTARIVLSDSTGSVSMGYTNDLLSFSKSIYVTGTGTIDNALIAAFSSDSSYASFSKDGFNTATEYGLVTNGSQTVINGSTIAEFRVAGVRTFRTQAAVNTSELPLDVVGNLDVTGNITQSTTGAGQNQNVFQSTDFDATIRISADSGNTNADADGMLQFYNDGSKIWQLGFDDSDSDSFKIARGSFSSGYEVKITATEHYINNNLDVTGTVTADDFIRIDGISNLLRLYATNETGYIEYFGTGARKAYLGFGGDGGNDNFSIGNEVGDTRIYANGYVANFTNLLTEIFTALDVTGTVTGTDDVTIDKSGNLAINFFSTLGANLIMERGGTNRANQIRFRTSGVDKWNIGQVDSDNYGDGTQFFIGENTNGTSPSVVIESGGIV